MPNPLAKEVDILFIHFVFQYFGVVLFANPYRL